MGVLVFLLITAIIIELRYKPRIQWANGDMLIYYNKSRFSTERDYLNITKIFDEMDNDF